MRRAMATFPAYFHCSVLVGAVALFWVALGADATLNFGNDLENNRSFKSVPTTIKTYENDSVLLPCNHQATFRFVRWHRDDVPLVDSRHPEMPAPDRTYLWPNGSLQVSNVQAEDTGDYYCEMMVGGSHVVQMHAIEVQYSPSVKSDPSGVIELPLGAIFEMVCEARGVPQPAITWRHNGNILDDYHIGNRQSHLVEVKSREMSGPIECLATNGVGQAAVAGVHLNVLFPPEVRAVQSVVYTKVGIATHLECIVEAAPPAAVHWFHHGVPVTLDARMTHHDNELQSNRSLSHYYTEAKHVLVLKKVQDSDLGLYECRGENSIGYKGITIDLTGRPMPCVFKINPGVQNSTAHVLVWQAESLSTILEYKLKFRQIPSATVTVQTYVKSEWNELTIPSELSIGSIHTTSYTLRGLQPASIFEVAVLARNHFGWSDNSKIVRFATGGEVELPNYSTESDLQYDPIDDNDLDFLNVVTQSSRSRSDNLLVCSNWILLAPLLMAARLFRG